MSTPKIDAEAVRKNLSERGEKKSEEPKPKTEAPKPKIESQKAQTPVHDFDGDNSDNNCANCNKPFLHKNHGFS